MHLINSPLPGLCLLFGALLSVGTVSAESACKGMQQDACAAKEDCLWVSGYVRKDGRSVSAHCKTRSRARSDSQTGSAAAASASGR